MKEIIRCDWANKSELEQKYHDEEWGIPVHDDKKLFKSYKEGFKDGEQLRDFVYVKDVVDIMHFMLVNDVKSGIYNIGTGKARSFMDLSVATMKAASQNDNLDKNETPDDLSLGRQFAQRVIMVCE